LIGTWVVLLFGNGVVAQTVLSKDGGWLNINLGFGLGVTLGMLATGGISGAHLNPAVSVALAVHGKFPWRRVLPYSIAQIIGGMLGAAR
jgi:glycerol uptake facilitator-like aquaporin